MAMFHRVLRSINSVVRVISRPRPQGFDQWSRPSAPGQRSLGPMPCPSGLERGQRLTGSQQRPTQQRRHQQFPRYCPHCPGQQCPGQEIQINFKYKFLSRVFQYFLNKDIIIIRKRCYWRK